MSDFRQLSGQVWASPQIDESDIAEAKALGFCAILSNRPDGEAPGQPATGALAELAQQAGLTFHSIPITHAGFSQPQVDAMANLLRETDGKLLAFCRSGTRSTLLWALASASMGESPDDLATAAAAAGYDLAPVRPAMEMLANRED